MHCWLTNWRFSRALAAHAALPAKVQRHLAACPACRADWQLQARLTAGLAADEPAVDARRLDALRAGVLAAVASAGSAEPAPARPVISFARPAWGIAALAAAAVAILLLLPPTPPTQPPAPAAPSQDWLADGGAAAQAATVLLTRTVPAGVQAPLDTELQRLQEDARSAAAFLCACLE